MRANSFMWCIVVKEVCILTGPTTTVIVFWESGENQLLQSENTLSEGHLFSWKGTGGT